MESDQHASPHHGEVYRAVDEFLQQLMVLVFQHDDGVTDEATVRRHVVGFLGTATLRPGAQRAQRRDGVGWAELRAADGRATVRAQRDGRLLYSSTMDPLEARAFLLSANATATALRYFGEVVGEVLGELEYQRQQLAAGLEPVHPGRRAESPVGAAGCGHEGLPPAGSVPAYTTRYCPACRAKMRSYPPSAGGPEWREIPE